MRAIPNCKTNFALRKMYCDDLVWLHRDSLIQSGASAMAHEGKRGPRAKYFI